MEFDKMMNKWLDSDASWEGFEKEEPTPVSVKGKNRSLIKKLPPQDSLDLHGRTITEAEQYLHEFLMNSRKNGYKKVLIIHGKGNHSKEGPVLGLWVKNYLESSPICGESGTPLQRDGGSGATWVILKD